MRLFSILALLLIVSCSGSKSGSTGDTCKTNADCKGATDTCQSVGGKMQCAAQVASNCKTAAACVDGFECASDHKCQCAEKTHCAANEGCFVDKCGFRRVFVSSKAFTPGVQHIKGQSEDSFGSALDASNACQTLADAANLGGKWAAWIADSTSSAINYIVIKPVRIEDGDTVNVVLIDGTPVSGPVTIAGNKDGNFASHEGATNCKSNFKGDCKASLKNKINLDENMKTVTGAGLGVWTGMVSNSFAVSSQTKSCANWRGTSGDAIIGDATFTDSKWYSFSGQKPCKETASLYCLEVDK